MDNGHRRFSDPKVEHAFQLTERAANVPMVRLYAITTFVVMLAYALVNPRLRQ